MMPANGSNVSDLDLGDYAAVASSRGGGLRKPFHNPVEGPAMMAIGAAGVLSNLLCLMVLRRQKELGRKQKKTKSISNVRS